MVKSDKEKGDEEYKAGYDTGRDGDPATRAFDSFFGYTNSDSTYGKGYQEGLSDRHEYGSRSDNSSTENSSNIHNSSPTDCVSDTSSVNSNTYSTDDSGNSSLGSRGRLSSLEITSYGLIFGILFVYLVASFFIGFVYGVDFLNIIMEKYGFVWGMLINLFFLPGVLFCAAIFVIFLIISLVLIAILGFFGINLW